MQWLPQGGPLRLILPPPPAEALVNPFPVLHIGPAEGMANPTPGLGALRQEHAPVLQEQLHGSLDLGPVSLCKRLTSFGQLGLDQIIRCLDHLQGGKAVAAERSAVSVLRQRLVEPLPGKGVSLRLAQLYPAPGDLEEAIDLHVLRMAASLRLLPVLGLEALDQLALADGLTKLLRHGSPEVVG